MAAFTAAHSAHTRLKNKKGAAWAPFAFQIGRGDHQVVGACAKAIASRASTPGNPKT
jgi:hypothetical protein